MTDHVVSPALFDSLDEYVEQLNEGVAISEGVVPATSPLLSFIENAFAQLFENAAGVEITGFDLVDKRRAARLRRKKDAGLSKELKALLALFEQMCDVHEDVLGAGYGGQASVLEEFHFVHVSRMLERLVVFARSIGDTVLVERVEESSGAFEDAIERYKWDEE